MNSEEFIGRLPKDGWTVNHLGIIRRIVQVGDTTVSCCPITSLNNKSYSLVDSEILNLGIDKALADDIVCASDNHLERQNVYDLRQKLLRALNLLG